LARIGDPFGSACDARFTMFRWTFAPERCSDLADSSAPAAPSSRGSSSERIAAERGVLYLNGRELKPLQHPAEAIEAGLALVPEDRKTSRAVFLEQSVSRKSDPAQSQAARVLARVSSTKRRESELVEHYLRHGARQSRWPIRKWRSEALSTAAISKRFFCWRAVMALELRS